MVESGPGTLVWEHIQNKKFTIYRISDDISNLGYSNYFITIEQKIIKTADIVLPASKPLYERARKIRGNSKGIFLLPNGTDLKIFLSSLIPFPKEYNSIPRPIAIYSGSTNMLDMNI